MGVAGPPSSGTAISNQEVYQDRQPRDDEMQVGIGHTSSALVQL